MDLDSMKYPELRRLAKELGLKANVKADKLLKAIKQHYQQENNNMEGDKEEEGQQGHASDGTAATKDGDASQEVSSTAVFVNTRRGKGNGAKRKLSDAAAGTECDGEKPSEAAEGDTEVDASRAPCNPRGAKKRKVSSKDSDKPAAEPLKTSVGEQQQSDVKDEALMNGDAEKEPKVAKAGKIPRYNGLLQKKKPLKPITPNFKKLHEAHFNKMESIDSYVQRKTKQMETYKNPVKEQKMNPTRATVFSPVPVNKKAAEEKRRQTLLSASKAPPNKPAGKEDVPFRPSVLSTRRINVRFSAATRDNEHKKSLIKTPARMSPCVTSSTPRRQTTATKTAGPFVFTGNTSTLQTPGAQKTPNFDLKASLSRPLTYKPHKGKLKPFVESKDNTAANDKQTNDKQTNAHQENYKQHKVQSRDERRTKQKENRKQKKENLLGARRGLAMM
ncbi:nucleolar and spindle-associated protein 1 [Brachyistius frenatus]|uniref:nucleolar and spindle-associated protein 1 n=1 Tax=Brachyistius frenatus TaxID=100188 RepID=UPI0037E9888B